MTWLIAAPVIIGAILTLIGLINALLQLGSGTGVAPNPYEHSDSGTDP